MKTIVQLTAVSIISLGLFSCNQQDATQKESQAENTEKERIYPVKTQKILREEISIEETYPATISAGEEVHLAPTQPGQIQEILVDAGDKVSKGQLLIKMDPTQLNQTRIQYYDAKRDLQRMDSLIKYNSISKQQYDKVKLQYEVIESNLQMLEENTNIRAPFSGVITGKYFNDKENFTGVAPQLGVSAIVTLMQISTLKAEVHISEHYFPNVKKGMKTTLKTNIYPEKIFKGTITTIYPTIDPNTKTFTIEIIVPNKDEKLRPGMFARVTMNLGTKKTIVVPSHALLKQEGTNNRYLFINDDGVAKRYDVEVGARYNNMIEIFHEEITEGMELIHTGHSNLQNGESISVSNDTTRVQ
ncbi:MAG: efflux RND transporter periplasmic adaptor subunit [Bacteroidales bacterium]|jgi:membrane fusion protein (multidrug efflux system)|nr:efflux RND transporter periplasmic adaptor subunit [Bacteroidales bacterium]